MRRVTLPTTYSGIDSVVATDGRPYNAHVRTYAARNMNRLAASALQRCLVNDSFALVGGGTPPTAPETIVGSPGLWMFMRPYAAAKNLHATRCVASLWGKIENTRNVYVQLVTDASPFVDATAFETTLAGDGTFKRYPTGGANLTARLRLGSPSANIALAVKGQDIGTDVDKNNNHSGEYDEIRIEETQVYLKARAGTGIGGTTAIDFTDLVTGRNRYIGIKQLHTDAVWRLQPARVVRVLSNTEIYIEPGWSLEHAGVPPASSAGAPGAPVWQLRKTSTLTLGCFAVYEADMQAADV